MTTIIYDFPNENFRKKFDSKEDALNYIEGKLPANGKNWLLRRTETMIDVQEETIDSKRKVIENKDIIKRIVDTFIEKATANIVRFEYMSYTQAEKALYEYKERLKKCKIEDAIVFYNSGNYKPCNNYKIEFPSKNDEVLDNGERFYFMPGIMFRNDDIYITKYNYVGRNVSCNSSKRTDETEELYNYCVKNLK